MVTRRTVLGGTIAATVLGSTMLGACSRDSGDGIVSVYSWRQEDGDGYKTIFDQFTAAHPDVQVKFEPFNSTDYDQILATAMQAGESLDVIQLRPYAGAKEIADGGELEPLDDLPGVSGFDPASLAAVSGSDGKVYGVPLALNALLTLTNTGVLDEHDIETPTTWDEFLSACDTLKTSGVTPIAQSGKAAYLLSILYQAVGTVKLSDAFTAAVEDGSGDFTSTEFRDSVQRVLDLAPYFPDSFIGMADDEARAMFAQGESAFYINGDYRVVPLQDLNAELEMGFLASLPDDSSGEAKLCTSVDGAYAMLSSSPDFDGSKALLEYMTTPEFGNAFSDIFGRLSPVPGTAPSSGLHVDIAAMAESSSQANPIAAMGGGQPDVKAEFETLLQGALGGQVTTDELFTKTQEAYEASRQ